MAEFRSYSRAENIHGRTILNQLIYIMKNMLCAVSFHLHIEIIIKVYWHDKLNGTWYCLCAWSIKHLIDHATITQGGISLTGYTVTAGWRGVDFHGWYSSMDINLTAQNCVLSKYTAPSHYLNQCWVIVNWTLKNILQWKFNQSTKLFIHQNASVNTVCEMTAILPSGEMG